MGDDADTELCGAETTDGTPCENPAASCPWHGEDADAEPRKTLLEEQPELTDLIAGELQNGATVPEACSEAGISERTYHGWRDKAQDDDPPEVFSHFLQETTRARRIAGRNDRDRLKDRCKETDDTRTWYKLHHDQYGDTYGEESEDSRDTGPTQPFGIPDDLIEQWRQEA